MSCNFNDSCEAAYASVTSAIQAAHSIAASRSAPAAFTRAPKQSLQPGARGNCASRAADDVIVGDGALVAERRFDRAFIVVQYDDHRLQDAMGERTSRFEIGIIQYRYSLFATAASTIESSARGTFPFGCHRLKQTPRPSPVKDRFTWLSGLHVSKPICSAPK
ncbi:hypothetical protein [Paraburkholderia sp. 2C]